MESKSDLLVFNKKEILVIVALLVLVALFSFTLGLRMGKALGVTAAAPTDHAPLTEPGKGDHSAEQGHGHDSVGADSHSSEHPSEHAEQASEEHKATAESSSEHAENTPKPGAEAEDKADAELAHEAAKEHVSAAKPMPMSLPQQKKGEGKAEVSYTLQVGSHRTVAEAAEQVSSLKRGQLEAFYIEAKVPGKGTWYRVGVGLFASKEAAEKTAIKWKASKSLPPYIVQKLSE